MKPLSFTRSVLAVYCALAVMLALPLARPATAAEPQLDASPAAPPWDFVTMGTLLRQSQGTRYLAIALGADETNVDWGEGPTACGLVAAYGRPGSYEQALRDLGLGDLLVDLRAGGVVPGVLPDGEHALGDATIDIRSQFDALLYLDVSPKMSPLAWAPCH